jgi:hypothetical protein
LQKDIENPIACFIAGTKMMQVESEKGKIFPYGENERT